MNFRNHDRKKSPSLFFRFMAWVIICILFLPAPLAGAKTGHAAPCIKQDGIESWNRHIHERLNSPERARALEEAARIEAEARAQFERDEATAQWPATTPESSPAASAPDAATVAQDKGRNSESSRPKTVTEALFNYAAGFAGVPGLAPRQGVDGYDEGLGFHQDGTVRKAGGRASAGGPSDRGRRARSYMQSGFQTGHGLGYGMNGAGLDPNSLYGEWGRDDSTRGGRISGQNGGHAWHSRALDDFDPMGMALDRGLSYGAGLLNSAGEAAISGLVDGGRARLNFHLDKDGYFGGEGDALLPWYDNQYTTVFTQIGARSMHDESDTRWIGNFGLGQRWFPAATEDDAGNWMIGYNAFFDYDFTRDHQRGGVGIETQYDWLRLASNYYFPLSNWKGSEDFDSDFVKERPAKGWDLRVKGYLPFYRNLAITGAYSQWYGDHVGMFGASRLEKDPKVWSYGLEYTPVPLVSGFITQKSTERGRADTEFGLNFTYHFQMPWEDQISHDKVADLRTVSGSRHEFVDRENRIILEYKAKNAYRIELLGRVGANTFKFRIMDGFGKYKAGQTVRVIAGGGVTLAEAPSAMSGQSEPQSFIASAIASAGSAIVDFFSVSTAHAADFSRTYTSDRNGEFIVRLDTVSSTPVVLTIQAGSNTQSFTLAAELTGSGTLTASPTTVANNGTSTLTFDGGAALAGQSVAWSVVSGLGLLSGEQTTTDGSGMATATLTANATGAGAIVVKATVNGKDYEATVTIGVSSSVTFQATTGGTAFSDHNGTEAIFTVLVRDSGVNVPDGTTVTWYVASTSLGKNLAVASGKKGTFEGLTLGGTPVGGPKAGVTSTTTSGKASIKLKDILGERDVTVTASVSSPITATATSGTFTFGKGPLSKFQLGYPDTPDNTVIWSDAITVCGGGAVPTLEAIKKYYPETKLPGVETGDNASASLYDIGGGTYKGMRDAAGLPSSPTVWSGRAQGGGTPKVDSVNLSNNSYENVPPDGGLRWVLCVRTSP